ncbi:MAG: HU family DNA-binding protein [Atribacterota bacterium]
MATSKEELIAKVASDTGYTKKATKKAVDSVFDNILETVSTGNMIRLRGFGTFGIRKRASRMARNPRTGEKIQVKAINVPFFKPVKKLKEKVKQ